MGVEQQEKSRLEALLYHDPIKMRVLEGIVRVSLEGMRVTLVASLGRHGGSGSYMFGDLLNGLTLHRSCSAQLLRRHLRGQDLPLPPTAFRAQGLSGVSLWCVSHNTRR